MAELALQAADSRYAPFKGNEDTNYKKKLLDTIETTYRAALDRGEVETVGETPATYRILFGDSWREDMATIIAETESID